MLLFFRNVLGYGTYVHICANWSPPEISSWLFLCCRCRLLQTTRSCSFWARPIFVQTGMHNFTIYIMLLWLTCLLLLFSCSLTVYFSLFFFSSVSTSEAVPVAVVITMDIMSCHWAFYVCVLVYHYHSAESGQALYARFRCLSKNYMQLPLYHI